jgi:secreted PhoX family phosphatase
MSDGNKTPLAHDGMAAFVDSANGTIRLVRNHEDRNGPNAGTVPGPAALRYDPVAGGGTTTLVVDAATRSLVRDFVSLSGTTVNCAGGLTPWNSWITCEETNAGTPSGWGKQHGYCFDVPASANGIVQAVHIPSMGRFAHEAVAVDPKTGVVYETEDNGSNSGFYRFLPNHYGNLKAGGRLQMLAIDGRPNYDTRTGQTVGRKLPVAWVDIGDPDPAGTSSTAVFNQGFAQGGARFARLEGCWENRGSIFFVSTSGGPAGLGQVFEYRPAGLTRGWLTVLFESPGANVLDGPDNLAVSPQGALLLCEDGDNDQLLRAVTTRGAIFDFALNLQTDSEWAGATFAQVRAGGQAEDVVRGNRVTLFVNRQGSTSGPTPPAAGNEGMTFAIWGPWKDGAL